MTAPASLRRPTRLHALALCLAATTALTACGSAGDDAASPVTETADASSQAPDSTVTPVAGGLDVSRFVDGALAEEPTTEDCVLSDGASATCYRLTVAGLPADREVGPFCPSTATSTAEEGGIWFDGDAVYDLDGAFFTGLADLYGDDAWDLVDDEGDIAVVETQEEFENAARPDVDASLQNHCVEGRLEWLEGGQPVTTTVLVPAEPVAAAQSSSRSAVLGVTLDGVRIDASAPVDAILGAYTIAAFDDCGGHFNPAEGYHLHGAVGCSEVGDAGDADTPQFGYALDGYALHSPFADDAAESAAGLDACGGHSTDDDGYHYHANQAQDNLVITCLVGQTVASEDAAGGPPGGGPPGRG